MAAASAEVMTGMTSKSTRSRESNARHLRDQSPNASENECGDSARDTFAVTEAPIGQCRSYRRGRRDPSVGCFLGNRFPGLTAAFIGGLLSTFVSAALPSAACGHRREALQRTESVTLDVGSNGKGASS